MGIVAVAEGVSCDSRDARARDDAMRLRSLLSLLPTNREAQAFSHQWMLHHQLEDERRRVVDAEA